MKKLDPHTLFSIFEKGDEEVYEEHGVTDVLDNPFVLMGMVLRGLENYKLMDILYQRNYPDEYKLKEPYIKFKYYNRMYGYLTRIEWNSFEDIYKIGQSFDALATYASLEDLMYYFEKIEHYEKCAVIKKFLVFLYKNMLEIQK